VDAALIASALLLGLAGSPHCAAMCAAPCAALAASGARSAWVFHACRVTGYAAAGAVVASSVSALASVLQLSPGLRPFWALLHGAALSFGLWLAVTARQPIWLARLGRLPPTPAVGGWQVVHGPARSAAAGALWVAWPCGLLQSALLVAALANGAASGAATMAAFALGSVPGLVLGTVAWRWLRSHADAGALERLATRMAGLLLAIASAWAVGRGLWPEVAAFCRRL
jgi:sulfite exporter TauE/SafE